MIEVWDYLVDKVINMSGTGLALIAIFIIFAVALAIEELLEWFERNHKDEL